MIDIFHCFACSKSLLEQKRTKKDEENFFFWCDESCHNSYQAKIKENGRVMNEWSSFMANEGPCPKEMKEFAVRYESPKKQEGIRTDIANGNLPKTTKGKRICGKCGEPGHNARTCDKNANNKPKFSKKFNSKNSQYICSRCGKSGHNKRTCKL